MLYKSFLHSSVFANLVLASFLFIQPAIAAQLVQTSPPQGGEFHATGTDNKTVNLSDFHGKLVLLYFGYTTCPDICPTNLSNLSEAMKLLTSEERSQVQVLMITVDPERDTQEKMDTYLPYFNPSFKGLTTSLSNTKHIADQYGAVYQKAAIGEGALGYSVDHSAFTYLIDQSGKLIRQLPHATTGEDFVKAIRLQLQNK